MVLSSQLQGVSFLLSFIVVSLLGSFVVMSKILTIVNKEKSIFSQVQNAVKNNAINPLFLSAILMFDIISESKYYTINLTLIMIFSYGFSIVLSLFS